MGEAVPGLAGGGRFALQRGKVLGRGSGSEVVKGSDTDTKEPVAVKVAPKQQGWQRVGLRDECANVEREARILCLLNASRHPNVVRAVGYWEDASARYLALEMCSTSLLRYVEQHGAVGRVMPRLLAEVVCGLQHLEEHGVVHRDVKPENLLLSADMHVRIADFGAAVLLSELAASGFAGSPEYCPPEMFEHSRSAGTPSDVWSFGCVFYEVCAGAAPFAGYATELDLFERIKAGRFNPLPAAEYPDAVRDFVAAVLVTDPARRPSLQAVADAAYFADVDWANLPEMCNVTAGTVDHTVALERFLLAAETVLHASTVVKARHLTKKTRTLVLTTLPRLFYIDPETDTIKGSIDVGRETRATAVTDAQFEVSTPGRVYYLSDLERQADAWAQKINALVADAG